MNTEINIDQQECEISTKLLSWGRQEIFSLMFAKLRNIHCTHLIWRLALNFIVWELIDAYLLEDPSIESPTLLSINKS